MIDDIKSRLDSYSTWLRDNTHLRPADDPDWVEITMPFLDRHNDYPQIYVRRTNDAYLLTDDGYTLVELEQSGTAIDSPDVQAVMTMTLARLSVRRESERLEVQATQHDFPRRLNDLVQAMLAVEHLAYTATITTPSNEPRRD